jgi:hypothetical protein
MRIAFNELSDQSRRSGARVWKPSKDDMSGGIFAQEPGVDGSLSVRAVP